VCMCVCMCMCVCVCVCVCMRRVVFIVLVCDAIVNLKIEKYHKFLFLVTC